MIYEHTCTYIYHVHVYEHSSSCHPQMQVKLSHTKNMNIDERELLWVKGHLKWVEDKWKTVLWLERSQFKIRFGKHGQTKGQIREQNHPACYQGSV